MNIEKIKKKKMKEIESLCKINDNISKIYFNISNSFDFIGDR